MKEIFEFKEKKIAILGLGIEGLALYSFLKDKAANLTVLDSLSFAEFAEQNPDNSIIKDIEDGKLISIFGSGYIDNLNDFDIIFRTPGISALNPKIVAAAEHGVTIHSQIKLFFDLCPCQIIGVTGTKGKGTTSTLIYEIIKENFESDKSGRRVYIAGNIGYPAITLLSQIKSNDIVILELSSFQLMDLKKSPSVAVITNLTVDHLNYHKDPEEYRSSKLSIIKYQTEDDFAVINQKAEQEFKLSSLTRSHIQYFGKEAGLDASVEEIEGHNCVVLAKTKEIICKDSEIELIGAHNLENIAAAVLVCDKLDIGHDLMKTVIRRFNGLPHRLEFVRELDGIKYINDSYATNPEPTLAAINSIVGKKILILGGSSKGADFTYLAQQIKTSDVRAVVLIGDEARNIERSLINVGFSGKVIMGDQDIEKIVRQARDAAISGDSVILSPACASFGLFKDYKDRGNKFKAEVMKLKSNQD